MVGDDEEDPAGLQNGLRTDENPGEPENIRACHTMPGILGHHLGCSHRSIMDLHGPAGVDKF